MSYELLLSFQTHLGLLSQKTTKQPLKTGTARLSDSCISLYTASIYINNKSRPTRRTCSVLRSEQHGRGNFCHDGLDGFFVFTKPRKREIFSHLTNECEMRKSWADHFISKQVKKNRTHGNASKCTLVYILTEL